MAQVNPPLLYEPEAPNFAPLTPLTEIQRGNIQPASSFQKALKDLLTYHLNLEVRTWEQLYLNGYEIANLIEGRQNVRPNPWVPGTYLMYEPDPRSQGNKRSLNFMRFYASNALWKWQLSNPDIVATAGIDTEEAREAAKAADLIIEHYEREFFPADLTIREALHGLCWGTYIWRIRYDDAHHSITALQPIFGEQEVTLGPGYGQCSDCGATGTSADFPTDPEAGPTCPDCGAPAVVESASEMVPTVVGQQQVQLGDICAELIPFPECRWDLNHKAQDSSWFVHQRRAPATAIHRLLGNIQIPGMGTKSDVGLDVVERLAYAAQAGGGRSYADFIKSKMYKEPVTIVEYSLGPDDIADIILEQPEPTVSGQVIPAGPLINTFPKGLTVQGLNGLNVITGVYSVHHSSEIVQGVWHSRVTSGAGQGYNDLGEVQKRFNADDSQIHTFLRAVGSPGMLYRQEVLGDIDRAEYLGDPEINIAVNGRDMPENMKLGDVVAPAWQPQSVPGQLFNYTYERLNDFAQITSHITDFAGGLPGVNNKTATGAQISQANSNALFTPPLQVKGEVRKRIAEIVLDLYRTHFPVDRPFALKGKYGRQQYVYLNGANLSTDVQLQVTKDSEIPKNNFTKREDYIAFFTLIGGAAGYAQLKEMFPELTADIQSKFNIDLDTNTYDHVASLCQQRIQQMKDAAQFASPLMAQMGVQPSQPVAAMPGPPTPGPPDETGMPTQGPPSVVPITPGDLLLSAIQPPPVLEEPDHDKKAQYLSEWLDFDEGQTADPLLRRAVISLIQMHFQFFAMTMAAKQSLMGPPPGQEGAPQGGGPPDKGGNAGGPPSKPSDKPNTGPPNTDPHRPITGRPAPRGAP